MLFLFDWNSNYCFLDRKEYIMNYYYNLTLNSDLSKFYEWTLKDSLIEIKKIPVFKTTENTLINMLKYDGYVNSEFLNKIYNQTTYKEVGKIKTITYAAILTDTKFCLAIIFDDNGYIKNRSYLLLEDELNILEFSFSLKKEKVIFNKEKKSIINNNFKQEVLMRKAIKEEIDKAIEEKDKNKLIYYYLEWFNNYSNNVDYIYKTICSELEKEFVMNLEKMYNLILLVSKQQSVK